MPKIVSIGSSQVDSVVLLTRDDDIINGHDHDHDMDEEGEGEGEGEGEYLGKRFDGDVSSSDAIITFVRSSMEEREKKRKGKQKQTMSEDMDDGWKRVHQVWMTDKISGMKTNGMNE